MDIPVEISAWITLLLLSGALLILIPIRVGKKASSVAWMF